MTEEIKEILEDLGNKDNYIEEFGYQYKRISLYDSFQLLDYITNLQQEIGNLKTNEQINVEVHNKQVEIIKDYKSRCKKAIKYINNNKLYDFDYDKEELFEIVSDKIAKEYLLNILNGSDEK